MKAPVPLSSNSYTDSFNAPNFMECYWVSVTKSKQSPRGKFVEDTAQKIKFSINDFFSKYDQIHSFM